MATMEITPEQMISIAKEIKIKMGDWESCVNQVYSLYAELDAMFEGSANKEFTKRFTEDSAKFKKLFSLMESYQQAIIDMANDYKNADNEAAAIARKK